MPFLKFALQGSAVQFQLSCGSGNIAVIVVHGFLNGLPFGISEGGRGDGSVKRAVA